MSNLRAGKNNFYFILLLIALFFVSFGIGKASLADTSKLRGSAWLGNTYQNVYFDCLDDVAGDRLDTPYNLCGGVGGNPLICGTEPYLFHFYVAPCVNLVHHVSIDSSNRFSGSAWNYLLGLITFDATSTPAPDYTFNTAPYGNCATCTYANQCSACYNPATQQAYGYAWVISNGNFIKLNSTSTVPVALQDWNTVAYYGVDKSVLPGTNIPPGDFVGTASSPLGDLSFNCQSELNGLSNCGMRNYRVYIGNLQIGFMSAPNWTTTEACTGWANSADLKWYKKSGTQSAYRVVINTINSTSSPVFDSGKISGTATHLVCPGPNCNQVGTGTPWTPGYNTNYYWWVQLWDETDTPTALYQYTTNSASDTDNNIDGNALTFTTYLHEFPSPYFTWSPSSVLVAATTTFSHVSKYYTTTLPNTYSSSCVGVNCSSTWSTTDLAAVITATNSPVTTDIFFKYATGTTVTLTVRDQDLYQCSLPQIVTINYGLPIWREVKAE